ncbi:hypothetical protein M0813_12788 [Anaeramoeba flamelloides]|uniref:Transmembrane protein n=1 Tax=Anaeramoeba flamelloides TaxID=1746091 RepID=A0ABQ8ZC23_9EUKA|nr:hypothetical protein M0813_12788 [Anaeramoeba flamelloides]
MLFLLCLHFGFLDLITNNEQIDNLPQKSQSQNLKSEESNNRFNSQQQSRTKNQTKNKITILIEIILLLLDRLKGIEIDYDEVKANELPPTFTQHYYDNLGCYGIPSYIKMTVGYCYNSKNESLIFIVDRDQGSCPFKALGFSQNDCFGEMAEETCFKDQKCYKSEDQFGSFEYINAGNTKNKIQFFSILITSIFWFLRFI